MFALGGRESGCRTICVDGDWFDRGQLERLSGVLAEKLVRQGVEQGDCLALVTPSSRLIALMLQACSGMGVSLFPIDPDMPVVRRERLMRQAGCRSVIESRDNPFSPSFDISGMTPLALKERGEASDKSCVVIATSGSSGEPKGVMLSEYALHANAGVVNARLGYEQNDCWLDCLPLHHIGGLSIVVRTALAGAAMILHQGFDPKRVWADLERYAVTHISLVPAMLYQLLEVSDGRPPEHLRVALVGGAHLDSRLARRALRSGWPLWASYGMSETASQVATGAVSEDLLSEHPEGFYLPLLDGAECRLIEESEWEGREQGRIRIRAPWLMSGYANLHQVAGEGLDKDGWFASGDLGLLDGEGRLRVLGRADDVIVSGGEKVLPRQVEELLMTCPGIERACVVGVDDIAWGQRLCAVYCGELSERAFERWCRESVDGVLRPRSFLRLREFPLLGNGKVDRQEVHRMAAD